MKKDLTQLVFILDKSGSMQGLESDTIGGFNSLIEKQKQEPGEVLVTTVLFDDEVEIIHDNIKLEEIPLLTNKEYYVGGTTALLDAVGQTINKIIDSRNNTPETEHPENTIVVITTDGRENASIEYDYSMVKKLIKKKEKEGWVFIFLGANIDVAVEAQKIGVFRETTVAYHCDSRGIEASYNAVNNAIHECRIFHELPSDDWRREVDEDYEKRK